MPPKNISFYIFSLVILSFIKNPNKWASIFGSLLVIRLFWRMLVLQSDQGKFLFFWIWKCHLHFLNKIEKCSQNIHKNNAKYLYFQSILSSVNVPFCLNYIKIFTTSNKYVFRRSIQNIDVSFYVFCFLCISKLESGFPSFSRWK